MGEQHERPDPVDMDAAMKNIEAARAQIAEEGEFTRDESAEYPIVAFLWGGDAFFGVNRSGQVMRVGADFLGVLKNELGTESDE